MNVLVVIFEQLLPISGGGTPRFKQIIDILTERGHKVSVAASFNVDIKEAKKTIRSNNIFKLNDARYEKKSMSKYLIYTPFNICKVIKESIKIKPDLIISNNSLAGLASLFAKKITKSLSIINIGDLLFEYLFFYSEYYFWVKYIQKLGRQLEYKVIKESDKIITVSNYMKHILTLKSVKKENINVIYDGVDTNLFRPKINDAKKLREKYASGAENVVMFHGGISPQDRLEIIAKAAVNIIKKHPQTVFWIVGQGSALPNIKKIININGLDDHFFFSGWVPYEKVPNFISACDIGLVILPNNISAKTKITLKTFEYWACEKPIIISNLSAPREVVIPGKTGLFYKPEDSEDLANKVSYLLEDKNLCREMGRAGRKIVEKNFNWKFLATKFVSICEDLYLNRC